MVLIIAGVSTVSGALPENTSTTFFCGNVVRARIYRTWPDDVFAGRSSVRIPFLTIFSFRTGSVT